MYTNTCIYTCIYHHIWHEDHFINMCVCYVIKPCEWYKNKRSCCYLLEELFILKNHIYFNNFDFFCNVYSLYYTSEYSIGFLILENIQKHTSIMFLACLVKQIWTLRILARRWLPPWMFQFVWLMSHFLSPAYSRFELSTPQYP